MILDWVMVLESDKSVLSIVCLAMSKIKLALDNFLLEASLTEMEIMQLQNFFRLRKNMTVLKLHLAASLLDPRIKGLTLSGSKFLEAIEYTETLAKSFPTYNEVDLSAIAIDITQFVNSTSHWANSHVEQLAGDQDFIIYWQALKKCSPLADLAIKFYFCHLPQLLLKEHSALEDSSTRNFKIR